MLTKLKQSSENESFWERQERKMKLYYYNLIHELFQSFNFSPFLYRLLLLIETLQFAYFSLFEDLPFLWKSDYIKVIRSATQYFQIHSALEEGEQGFFFGILYTVFAIQVLMLALLIIIINKITKPDRKNTTFLTYSIKLLSTYGILINTIITFPLFNIIFATIYCDSNSKAHKNISCYEGLYIMHLIVACISLLILLFMSILFITLLIDLNPNSTIAFASPLSKLPLFRLLFKIFLTMYITTDVKRDLTTQYIIVITLFYILMLWQRYRQPGTYDRVICMLQLIYDSSLFWISFCVMINAIFESENDIDDISIVYMIIGMPVISRLYYMQIQSRNQNILKMQVKHFKKDTDVELFIVTLINLVEQIENPDCRIKIEGVLKYHSRQCTNGEKCICYTLNQDLNQEDAQTQTLYWFSLVQTLLEEGIEKFKTSSRLHLLNSYIHHQNLKNKFKALFDLMYADESKPNIQEEFSIFRYKNTIEEELQESDQRSNDNKGMDVNQIISFQKKFVQFQNTIEESVQLYLQFWRELNENQPDIQKLQSLGSKITQSVESTTQQFKSLMEINSNNVQCLQKYGLFLKDIVNDEAESLKILEKMEYVQKSAFQNKQYQDNNRQKYGENSNACIINCSGNKSNVGTVTNCNNEIYRILGYSKNDIMDQSLNRIMPKVYQDLHNGFLERFLRTSEEKIIGKQRTLMAQNKQGYIVPCNTMVRVIPNLVEGIQFVGFIKEEESKQSYENNKVHHLIYNTATQLVLGVTRSCYDCFGIPSSIVYGNSTNTTEFTIDQVAPEIDLPGNTQEELRSASGCVVTFDTTYIQQNFLLEEDESNQGSAVDMDLDHTTHDISQNVTQNLMTRNNDTTQNHNDSYNSEEMGATTAKISKFKKIKVRVHLESENEYANNQIIRVIRFTEVDDNDMTKMTKQTQNYKTVNSHHQTYANTQGYQNQKEDLQDQDANFGNDQNLNTERESVKEEQDQDFTEDNKLKELKNLISEKTEPKNIQILKKTVFSLLVIVTVLSGIELHFKSQQQDGIKEGTAAIDASFQRHNTMVDVNYQVRKIKMLAANQFYLLDNQQTINPQDPSYISEKEKTGKEYQKTLATHVNTLQEIQFDVIRSKIAMEKKQDDKKDEKLYPLKFKLQNGDEQTHNHIFNDAMFQYITAASSLTNSTIESFNEESSENNGEQFVKSTYKNYFFVRENGLFVLRKGSEDIAEDFFKFYQSETDDYETTFVIIMACGIIFIFFSQVILIPIVFRVHNTNNKVLSLFVYIPPHEITQLVHKCETYLDQHLDGHQDKEEQKAQQGNKGNLSKIDEITADHEKLNESQQPIMQTEALNDTQQHPILETNQNNTTMNLPTQQNQTLQPPGPSQNNLNTTAANNNNNTTAIAITDEQKKAGQKKLENQKNEEEEQERSERFQSGKDSNNKMHIICQFFFFALIFIGYFVTNFALENQFLNEVRDIYTHLRYISMRPSVLKYNVMFTLETIATAETQEDSKGSGDLAAEFVDRQYDNEAKVFEFKPEEYSSQLDGYKELFLDLNYKSICDHTPEISEKNQVADCKKVADEMLEKGLRSVQVSILEDTREILNKFRSQIAASSSEQEKAQIIIDTSNSIDYQKIDDTIKYETPALMKMIEELLENIESLLDNQQQIETIKFSSFIVVALLVYILVWTPYLSSLNNKIWRTKGMLNMIPMDIIKRNPNLSRKMDGDDIKQAVS